MEGPHPPFRPASEQRANRADEARGESSDPRSWPRKRRNGRRVTRRPEEPLARWRKSSAPEAKGESESDAPRSGPAGSERRRKPPRQARADAREGSRRAAPELLRGTTRVAGTPASEPSAIACSWSLTSCADCQRSSGSLARQVLTTRSSAGGVIGWTTEIGCGSDVMIAEIRDAWLVPRECLPAGRHLVERRAESENVRTRIGLLPFELLRRHVRKRPEDLPLARHVPGGRRSGREALDRPLGSERLRQTEVEQLHARPRQHDVRRLQVPVDDAARCAASSADVISMPIFRA